MIEENVTKNFLDLAQENPQTEFYFFFPPYSIYFWEALADTKQLNMQIHAEQIATELLVQADNVHLFGFADRTEIVKDLNNYTDALHYSAEINSEILKMISNGEGEITKDNYQEYYQTIKALYEK